MNRLRTAVVGAAVWCAVVAGVATLVWVVIDRAGQGVVPEAQPQADVTGSLPVPGNGRSSQHTSPGPTLAPRPTRRTTGLPSLSARPSTSPVTVAPPPVQPTRQRRSWSGAAGHVVAECQGSTIGLVSAFPGTGWRYTILDRGPGQVLVRFQRLGEDRFVTVSARCVAGAPRFAESTAQAGDD
jgi:hypothetical protein